MARIAKLTASQQILLAGADLRERGMAEFSEWDLTVEVWKQDKNKFGCRGYEELYPDHKRVMMEIMARKKRDNPLRLGWLERTRPNHYRVTPLGMAAAARLKKIKGHTDSAVRSAADIYDAVVRYVGHRVFRDYCRDPEEPRTWLGAEAFLGITRTGPDHLDDQIRAAEQSIARAIEWFDESGEDVLRRGAAGGGITIRRQDVERLGEFLDVLQKRFKIQMEAIRGSP